MMLCRALPRTTILTPRMTFSLLRVDLKSTLINPNINRGPDSYPILQGKISPLNVGIGLLSPLGSHILIRTIHNMTPLYYREVALFDIPSQYAEEVDTFRRILRLPDPGESLPRSSTAVMGLDEKGR